jgi:hypothetical protein
MTPERVQPEGQPAIDPADLARALIPAPDRKRIRTGGDAQPVPRTQRRLPNFKTSQLARLSLRHRKRLLEKKKKGKK